MTTDQVSGVIILSLGYLGMGASAGVPFIRQWTRAQAGAGSDSAAAPESDAFDETHRGGQVKPILWFALILIIAAGAFIRLDELDLKTISHPEAYVPGINLPAGVSEPPPRTTLPSLLYFHFYREPHPPGYYFLMCIWTKCFGTSLYSIRLPSVIFGILSVFLTFWIARALFNESVGLISSSLVAFNGHQVYWSQGARMYSMLCFLGLLSVWLLIKLLSTRSNEKWVLSAVAYVMVVCLGVYTEILFWPFLAGQILFVFLRRSFTSVPNEESSLAHILDLQVLVVILGAPMWAHAAMTGRQSPLEPLSAVFLSEFLSFGFLFERDNFSLPTREIAGWLSALSLAFAMFCLWRSLHWRPESSVFVYQTEPLDKELLTARRPTDNRVFPALAAVCSLVVIIGFTMASDDRRGIMLSTGLVPIAAILFLTYADRLADRVRKGLNSERAGRRMRDGRVLLATLCFFPVGCVASVSLFDSLIASRVFLIFTPYLLVLISVGINEVSHRLVSSLLIAALLITLHVGSLIYYKEYPTEALDYKDLTGVMNANSQKGDVFVVHKQSWVTTPLFYYLDQNRFKIVAEGLATELNDPETRRVWVVNFEGQPLTDEMRDALAGYQPQFASRGKRAEVVMYERVER